MEIVQFCFFLLNNLISALLLKSANFAAFSKIRLKQNVRGTVCMHLITGQYRACLTERDETDQP